jgi:hypothetical protein
MKKKIIIALLVLIIIIVLAGSGLFWLYTGQQTAIKYEAYSTLHLPAALVDKTLIPIDEVVKRYGIAKSMEGGLGDVTESEAKNKILNKLVNDTKLVLVAKKYGVSLGADDLEREYEDIVNQIATGNKTAFEQAVKERSGMTIDEFKTKIIGPIALESRLKLWYNNQESLNNDVYAKIEMIRGKIESGEDIGRLAKEFSEDDASKEFAGEVGEIPVKDLLPEFSSALKDVETGKFVTIHSRHGHHLVKIISKNEESDASLSKIKIQEVFLKSAGFEQWYGRQSDSWFVRKFINFN